MTAPDTITGRHSGTDVVGRRIVAALIDLGILWAVFAAMALTVGQHTASGGRIYIGLTGSSFLLFALLVFAYYQIFEWLAGATPGKLAMRLRVVSLDDRPLTFSRVLIRTVLRLVDGLPFFYLAGLVAIAVSKSRQRIGDMAARTAVVSV